MRGELAVRINDGTTDRHVTRYVRGLRFTKAAPGGFHSASLELNLPQATFNDLGPADKVFVYDAATGKTLWEGFTQNPGAVDGAAGQRFDLSAIGTSVLATDEARGAIYIDRRLDPWFQSNAGASVASGSAQATEDPATSGNLGQVIKTQLNPGVPITTGGWVGMAYHQLGAVGMEFGAMFITTRSGMTDTNYRTELVTPLTFFQIGPAGTINTTATSENRWVDAGGPNPPAGTTVFLLRLRRAAGGATNITVDTLYSIFGNLAVLGRRMDRFGTLVVSQFGAGGGMKSNTYVQADWVVEDLLGRVLTFCDKNASTIEATTFQIDQLAYPEAVNARRILEDLAGFEPDFLWELLHSTPSGYVFNYRAWPTNARYEISTADGYNKTGGDVDLCNRIAVTWTDPQGRKQVEVVTATVPELDVTSRIRDADPVELSPGNSSSDNAVRYGQEILAAKNTGPKSATARLGRPVMDLLSGSRVQPWEIEPGYMVRVRESGDLLRLTEMEYVDDDGAAILQLGLPTPTVEERLAGISANRAGDPYRR